jgi:hypothetical protein
MSSLRIFHPCHTQSSPTCEPVVANDDVQSTPMDTPVVVSVLLNDEPAVPGMGLSVTNVPYDGSNGKCIIVGTGIGLMYVPESNFDGIDTCVYEACDEEERCGTATVTIVVVPPEDEPLAYDDEATTDKEIPVSIFPLENDIAVPQYDLVVTSITKDGSRGTCVVDSNTMVMYIPDSDFVGVDECIYKACDERDKCATATITIVVKGEKSEPCADNDVAITDITTPSVRRNFQSFFALQKYECPQRTFLHLPHPPPHHLITISHQPVTSEPSPSPVTATPFEWITPNVRIRLPHHPSKLARLIF